MCIVFVEGLSRLIANFAMIEGSKLSAARLIIRESLGVVNDFPAFSIIQAVVAGCIWFEIGFAQDRLDTSVGVLDVRSSFTFKGYHCFKVEVISICTACLKIIELIAQLQQHEQPGLYFLTQDFSLRFGLWHD